jgi:hypothetical protein
MTDNFTALLSEQVNRAIPEYAQIAQLASQSQGLLKPQVIEVIEHQGQQYPLLAMSFGSEAPDAPAITFVGGIHGVERIGIDVILSYLHTLIARAQWDNSLVEQMKNLRLNFLPMINPVGVHHGTRANGNGVDLMRNAPIDAKEKVPWLVGGQQISSKLPWYRGDGTLERENQALIDYLKQQCLHRPFNLVVDCHSGFGLKDRLWIPYAYRKRPPRKVANYFALQQLLQATYPHNKYVFEPQSNHYTTHGDLWDHVGKIVKHEFNQPFLSLTLEMGSWRWVKKRPIGLLSFKGMFNPVTEHRWLRAQRSHLILFDFLKLASLNYQNWLPTSNNKAAIRKAAINHWYRT